MVDVNLKCINSKPSKNTPSLLLHLIDYDIYN